MSFCVFCRDHLLAEEPTLADVRAKARSFMNSLRFHTGDLVVYDDYRLVEILFADGTALTRSGLDVPAPAITAEVPVLDLDSVAPTGWHQPQPGN